MNDIPLPPQPAPEGFPFQRLPNESLEAFEGFLTFFQLKEKDRKLNNVAEILGVQPGTVRNWSSEFKWRNRLHEYHLSLLAYKTRAEVETKKAEELAKLERQKQEELELEAVCREMRTMVRDYYKDYTLHHMDKTRLDEITRMLVASVRLPHLAAAAAAAVVKEMKKEGKAPDKAATGPYLDAIRKTYGPKPPQPEPPTETPPSTPEPPKQT